MGPDQFFQVMPVVLGLVAFLILLGIFVRLGRIVNLLERQERLDMANKGGGQLRQNDGW